MSDKFSYLLKELSLENGFKLAGIFRRKSA